MKPALWMALVASLGLSAWLALQPDDTDARDAAADRVVAPRRAVAATPPRVGDGPNTPSTRPAGNPPPPTSPGQTQAATDVATATPALPARAADWPAAPARALLAWGAPPPPVAAPVRTPPPTPPAPPPPPERPRAPAFPYQWIGTLDDGRGAQALLGGALRGAAVRAGQVLDGQWRVERIREQQIDLTWLPGEQSVSVRSGGLAAGSARPAHANAAAPDNDNPEADSAPAS